MNPLFGYKTNKNPIEISSMSGVLPWSRAQTWWNNAHRGFAQFWINLDHHKFDQSSKLIGTLTLSNVGFY
jgi:hypothetical protein